MTRLNSALALREVSPLTWIGGIVAAVLALYVITSIRRKAKQARLPPGIKQQNLPIHPWRFFYEQSKQYGPLTTYWEGSSPRIVCNDIATTDFFMEKHARDTAARSEWMQHWGTGGRLLFVSYGDRFRSMRKALHSALQPSVARDLRSYQEEKIARDMVVDILYDPDHFQDHVQTYAASLTVNMAYGRTDKAHYSDPDIQSVIATMHHLGEFMTPGSFLLQSYPWLSRIPFYTGNSLLKKWGQEELDLFRAAVDRVKERQKQGTQRPCFVTYLFENQKNYELEDNWLAVLAGEIFSAGSDTSSAAINIVIMAAAMHPDAAQRVQAELDELFGDHPPTFDVLDDYDQTPILRAFISETYRWRPVSAGGFPHCTTRDITYENYVIPAGTAIVGNHWGISRDATYYGDNVEEMDIDRWLKNGKYNQKMKYVQFGFGRRVCPGQHVANNSLLIATALLLWGFNISRKVQNGREVDIDTLAFTNTANMHLLPFQAHFEPRQRDLAAAMANL